MNASFRLSSPSTKTPPKSAATLWTARLVATLWKLAVKRARNLRRQTRNGAAADHVDLMHGDTPLSSTSSLDLDDDASIMREAALSVVASGVVSLADLEAVTGFRLPKTRDHGATAMKDDDANSEAATDTSDDSCSIADSDAAESLVDVEESIHTPVSTPKTKLVSTLPRRETTSSTKPTKWVCVGYGRYVKAQE